MSLKYAEKKIEEALKQAKGNPIRARQRLIAWTFEDPKLLHELTKNHLTGIVAYHIERVLARQSKGSQTVTTPKPQPKAAVKPQQPPAPPKKKTPEEQFGEDLLRAVTDSDSELFGFSGSGRPQKRGQASEQHINALRAMAAKSSSKKSD